MVSERGYGLVLAADTAICCDIPAYGSYLYMENKGQMDFYFAVGKGKREVESALTLKRLLIALRKLCRQFSVGHRIIGLWFVRLFVLQIAIQYSRLYLKGRC